MPMACSQCTLPSVQPVAVNKCPACGDDVHSDCLNQHLQRKHARAFDVWTQGLDLHCNCFDPEHDCGKRPDICDCCVETVIRNHNRNQKKNPTIVSWPPNICDCCAESIGESAVRSYMRQKKEPNVPKRKTNRSMTKTAIVKHVASTNEVT